MARVGTVKVAKSPEHQQRRLLASPAGGGGAEEEEECSVEGLVLIAVRRVNLGEQGK